MRTLTLGAVLLLAGCDSFPIMAEPKIAVSPYLSEYRLHGDLAMQNDPGTGLEDNAAQSLRTFGFGSHEDDLGVRTDIGDGFAGLRIDYYRLTMNTTRSGILTDDVGSLLAGDPVRMAATMDEWRLGWSHRLLDEELAYRGQPLSVRLALGATWAHRDLALHLRTTDGARTQAVHQVGDAFYPSIHLRAGMRAIAVDVEYAIAPGLALGDLDGVQHDIEARVSYTVPYQDVTLFAGYRYSVIQGKGHEDGFAYDTDLALDGLQFGLQVSF